MDVVDKEVKAHLFICCRIRQGKPSCGEKGAEALAENLKKWTKNNNLSTSLKVSRSSCLGHCEEGITACIYPQNQWITHINLDDEKELQEILSQFSQSK